METVFPNRKATFFHLTSISPFAIQLARRNRHKNERACRSARLIRGRLGNFDFSTTPRSVDQSIGANRAREETNPDVSRS
jgi:hypothetical protein